MKIKNPVAAKPEPRSVLIPMIVCVAAALIGRLSGIVSSYFATDVMYEGTAVTTILPYFPMIFQAVSFAAVSTAVAVKIRDGAKCASAALIYMGVLLADAAAVILYDTFSGYYEANYSNVGVEFYTYIILYRLIVVMFSLLLLLIAYGIMKMLTKHRRPLLLTASLGAVVPVAVDLGAVTWQSVSAMIEREFVLLDSEITSILLDVGVILACAAVAVGAVIVLSLVYKKS